jgi:outer membrane protein assembly factor BamA
LAPESTGPDYSAFEGDVVREIRILNKSLFDPDKPGENKLLFRMANRVHRTTRPQVIQQQILLQPGEPFSVEALKESERLLRANQYLYEAQIRPVAAGDGQVDLEVETRDVWTLRGGVTFSRAGGENMYGFNLEDSNFLGTGKEVTLLRVAGIDRTSNVFRFRDPNLGGSRTRLELSYADNTDGGRKRLELERPFYSFDTRWASGVRVMFDERVEPLYDEGFKFQEFTHEQEFGEVYLGFSPGLSDTGTHRWRVGYTYDHQMFGPFGGLDSDSLIPESRELSFVWFGYEFIEDGFVTERGLDRLQATEDLNLGTQFHWRLGYSSTALGADRSRMVADSAWTTGWRPSPRQLLLTTARGSTRWKDETENMQIGATVEYYARNFWENVFYVGFRGDLVDDADLENQLLIGGETGLRGYPIRLQSGDRRWLATVEQRFFSNREFFHVLHFGAAVFFDIGRSWYNNPPPGLKVEKDTLRDVGLGLRIGSSRSSKAAMIHLDVAFPLDGPENIKSMQWLVSSSETF